jgi:hypothetical protein
VGVVLGIVGAELVVDSLFYGIDGSTTRHGNERQRTKSQNESGERDAGHGKPSVSEEGAGAFAPPTFTYIKNCAVRDRRPRCAKCGFFQLLPAHDAPTWWDKCPPRRVPRLDDIP